MSDRSSVPGTVADAVNLAKQWMDRYTPVRDQYLQRNGQTIDEKAEVEADLRGLEAQIGSVQTELNRIHAAIRPEHEGNFDLSQEQLRSSRDRDETWLDTNQKLKVYLQIRIGQLEDILIKQWRLAMVELGPQAVSNHTRLRSLERDARLTRKEEKDVKEKIKVLESELPGLKETPKRWMSWPAGEG